jgi:AraC family transcriptional regulator
VTNPYDLLEGVLASIEEGLKEEINIEIIAGKFDMSVRHLQRMFKFAFNQTIGLYIRSRKLAASIDDLFNAGLNILDIALEYGFEYESSYIRSFQREYGITPGDLRKTGKIIKITPPLQIFNSQKYPNGVMFGPDIVVVPQFHVVGKRHKLPFHGTLAFSNISHETIFERPNIPNLINPDVFFNICSGGGADADYFYVMPSFQVKALDTIPEGFDSYTFSTSLCANFRFIFCKYDEINMHIADDMFRAIDDFMDNKDQEYFLDGSVTFDRTKMPDKNENYCQWGWFAPVIKKTSLKIPPHSPSGIKDVYQQELPALRFIGKKYIETSETVNVLTLLDNWQLNGWFDSIEKQYGKDLKTFFDGGDSYINLVQKKDGLFTHWMGMFMPEGTNVPEGYEALDFPQMTLGICRVYGKRDEIVHYEAECRNKLTEEGYAIDNVPWYFRRFGWRRFFEIDVYRKRLLDYCFPVI